MSRAADPTATARLERRLAAEFLGTAVLVATVVGSGIMGTLLSDNLALTLLINAVATVAALGVLIAVLGPISGAHFNPVVTGVAVSRREMPVSEAGLYIVVQILGALAGVAVANIMFDLPAFDPSTHVRTGFPLWLGEIVATAGLLLVIGAANSSNSVRLAEVALRAGASASHLIESADDLDWAWLEGVQTVGITAGASAPEDLVEGLIAALSARFDATVEEVRVTDEDVVFKLPRVLVS